MQKDWTISLKAAMDVVEKVEAPSPTELVVTLEQPSNDWLYRMTTRIGAMFDENGVADLANDPVGTGPYDVSDLHRGDSITLTRNDDYWGEAPYFQTVTLQYFKDPTALNNALLSGTIDVIGTVQAPEALEQFEGNEEYQVIEGTTNGEVVLSMNNAVRSDERPEGAAGGPLRHRPPGADGHLLGRSRRADRQHGAADRPVVRGPAPATTRTTRTQAEQLLQESDAADQTVRLRLPTLPYADACGQVVKSQLEEVGFTVELDQLEFPAAWLHLGVHQRRLRHVDHRARGAARHGCGLRRPEVLHALRRPGVPGPAREGRPGQRRGADGRTCSRRRGAVARTPLPTGCSCCPT